MKNFTLGFIGALLAVLLLSGCSSEEIADSDESEEVEYIASDEDDETIEEVESEADEEIPSAEDPTEFVEFIKVNIHDPNSARYVKTSFDDLELIHEWEGPGDLGEDSPPDQIFPFYHYYSETADTTFLICEQDRTVAVCDGYKDETLTEENSGDCTVYDGYAEFMPAGA